MAKRKTSGALTWIVKEAKRLRREYPNRYNHLQNPWRDGYIAQASAIYATKHGGKSPVGHKKHKSLKMTGFKNIEEKEYIVNTKNGNTFHVKAYNLKEAKKYASFNARHQKDSVERVFLNKNKIRGITTKSKSHTDKNRITANIQVGSIKKPFTIQVLKKKYPRDMMGWREREVLLHGINVRLRNVQPGVYLVKSSKGEFLFTFKHPHHKDFSVVG